MQSYKRRLGKRVWVVVIKKRHAQKKRKEKIGDVSLCKKDESNTETPELKIKSLLQKLPFKAFPTSARTLNDVSILSQTAYQGNPLTSH